MPENVAAVLVQILPLVLIVVVFYFLLIRPQRKKDKEVKNMLANLKVGDRITTIGGIYGTISAIKDDVITIDVGADQDQDDHRPLGCALPGEHPRRESKRSDLTFIA